jgi:hypothetical protein
MSDTTAVKTVSPIRRIGRPRVLGERLRHEDAAGARRKARNDTGDSVAVLLLGGRRVGESPDGFEPTGTRHDRKFTPASASASKPLQ